MVMLQLLLSTLPPLFLLILVLIQRRSRMRNHRLPPGPKGLPFIGNIHQVDISKPHIWLTEQSNKYGPLIYLKLCRVPVVVVSSPDMAKKALKLNDVAFAGRPYTFASFKTSYDHSDIICSPYTEYWRNMRKMVAHHLFSYQKLRSYCPIRDEEVSAMIDVMTNKANTNEAIDVGEILRSFNCDVLCRVAFGKKLEMIGTQSSGRLGKITNQILSYFVETYLADCVVTDWINVLSGAGRRVEKILKEIDSFYQQLIDEHLDPNRPDSMSNDIIDLLIQLREDESAPVKIDWKHIKGVLMNIFMAGTDTTGASLVWAMTSLMKNPNAMKRVQQEIRSLVRNKNSLDGDDIEKLPYLKAVVKETLRLYPPVPFIPRSTTQACDIDGYEIEENTVVFVNTWAIGRDPQYWENANDFLPERFLNKTIHFKGQEFGFIPFGTGRRVCVGIGLAIANIEVALANLLYFFNWEIPHGMTKEDIDTNSTVGLVLCKKNPLYLIPTTYI